MREMLRLALILVAGLFALVGCQSSLPSKWVESEEGYDHHFVAVYEVVNLADNEAAAATAWPKDYRLTIDLKLANVKSGKYRRPYVAVWVEDSAGEPVRFLTLWGKSVKYKQTLRDFWPHYRLHDKPIAAVTGPTRGPGDHELAMDGLDSAGKPLPPGDYTVHVEVVREHGTRVHMKQAITCKDKAVTETIKGNVEVEGVTISFGPAAGK